MAASKDTVYIDIDEDITSVINKVEGSDDKVVALVLPKRATVFQSTINMKLLKKAASKVHKSIVLITSDTSILPLAGAARLHVAKSLQSKPSIPDAPHMSAASGVITSEEFAGASAATTVPAETSAAAAAVADDVIELDNTDKQSKMDKSDEAAGIPTRKNRKLKVPNFNRFRVKVYLSILLVILLIVGYIFGYIILPKAKITIKTDATTSPVNLQLTVSTNAKTIDVDKAILPAILAETKKTDTEKVPATGKQDQGTMATGSLTLFDCSDNPVTVPAGTTFSNSGYSFTTDVEVVVPNSDSTFTGNCKKNHSIDVNVTAVKPGGDSNLSSGRSYVTSLSDIVTGTGGAMGGGTSKIVIVVSQDDISAAQAKMTGRQKSAAVGELDAQLNSDGNMALDQTLDEAAPVFTQSIATNQPATDVTVTAVTDYKMLGIASKDLTSLVEATITKSITNSKEKVLNNGLDNKTLLLASKKNATEQVLSLTANATVGPDIDKAAIARDAAGKKRGDIITLLGSRDGVKDVNVTYSPFWVLQTPKKASKITVVIDQSNATQ